MLVIFGSYCNSLLQKIYHKLIIGKTQVDINNSNIYLCVGYNNVTPDFLKCLNIRLCKSPVTLPFSINNQVTTGN